MLSLNTKINIFFITLFVFIFYNLKSTETEVADDPANQISVNSAYNPSNNKDFFDSLTTVSDEISSAGKMSLGKSKTRLDDSKNSSLYTGSVPQTIASRLSTIADKIGKIVSLNTHLITLTPAFSTGKYDDTSLASLSTAATIASQLAAKK